MTAVKETSDEPLYNNQSPTKSSTPPAGIPSSRHIPHHEDPLHPALHRHEADIILGSEILYTENAVHAYCLMRTIARYLKPAGVMYCVQSANREGMAQFVQLLRSNAFTVDIQPITSKSPVEGLLGHYSHAKDIGRGTGLSSARKTTYCSLYAGRQRIRQTPSQRVTPATKQCCHRLSNTCQMARSMSAATMMYCRTSSYPSPRHSRSGSKYLLPSETNMNRVRRLSILLCPFDARDDT